MHARAGGRRAGPALVHQLNRSTSAAGSSDSITVIHPEHVHIRPALHNHACVSLRKFSLCMFWKPFRGKLVSLSACLSVWACLPEMSEKHC